MSVAWSSRVALPGSRQACGHAKCKRLTRWSTVAITAAVAAEFGLAFALPADGTLAVTAAVVIFAAGLVLACWPHPRDDIEALVEATREMTPRPRLEWTAADWAAREKELKELSEP